ncbi:docking protein 3 [Betta splendens]|uniref:Docking protein 3 n=1 Tax=Betta splendens TaxID=158456 RepID=A0A6P7NVF6_BETSP|nr:docking protein 3 [Betta splendens]
MDVIFKDGMLYLQGAKYGKKIWRKIWMMLFKASSSGLGRLEFFNVLDTNPVSDQKKAGRQKTSERKVVRLRDCLSVTPAPKESCLEGYTCFYLSTTQCTYTLASMTSEDWISALCLLAFQKDPGKSDKGVLERGNVLAMEDNELYSSWKSDLTVPAKCHPVTVQSTEASRRCGLAGEYLVSPEKEAVALLSVNSCHVIYRWPYKLLRKFGLVEGGFSIEAGRRCDSGEGVFIFLSSRSHLIFQTISEQCSLERRTSAQTPPVSRRSLSEPSIVGRAPPHVLPVLRPADVSDDTEETHYATIKTALAMGLIQLPCAEPQPFNSKEAVGAAADDEDERCHSLEALKLRNDAEESIYYNLRRATPPPTRKEQLSGGTDRPECIYADISIVNRALNLQPQPFSPLGPEQPAYVQSASCSALRPRYQRQPPVTNHVQTEHNAQTQPVDDMQETEEAIGSPAAPTEAPGSFKHRLAEIISKDLAKVQIAPPSGSRSPAFTQY